MVITTFNRAPLLRHSLRRLAELTLPDELIVVDDGSTDDTEQVCREFEHLPIRYIYNHSPEPTICCLARNIGLRAAEFEWLVTSEPELVWVTDVIAQYRRLHAEHPSKVISSGLVHFCPSGWEPQGDYSPPPGSGRAEGWVAPHTALWGRDWLMEVGGWDESFPGPWGWDDTDLLTRLSMNGQGQYIAREIEALHLYHGIGADPGGQNEAHFLAKNLAEGDRTHLVANQGYEWGRVRERPA